MTRMCTADDTSRMCREFGLGRFMFVFLTAYCLLPSFSFWKQHLSGYWKERVVKQIYETNIHPPKTQDNIYPMYGYIFWYTQHRCIFLRRYYVSSTYLVCSSTHDTLFRYDNPLSFHILIGRGSEAGSIQYLVDGKWPRWWTYPTHGRSAPGDLCIPK